jgi:hypothetical protein
MIHRAVLQDVYEAVRIKAFAKHLDSMLQRAKMHGDMRTTVTLDPDVLQQLKSIARARNVPFKVALNDAVRAGLAAQRGGSRPFKVQARPMGLRPGVDLTHALRLAGDLEDEEILRKMDLRK